MFDNYLKIKPAFSEANQTSFPLNVSICATLANSFSIKHVLSTCIERTPPLFIEVPVPTHDSERFHVYV
jgi:hypothetical protein